MPPIRQSGVARVSFDLLSRLLGPSIVTQAFGLGVAFIAQIVIARAVDAAHFGTYSFVMAIVSGAAIFGRFGWDSTVMRFGSSLTDVSSAKRLQALTHAATVAVWQTSIVTVGIVVILGSIVWVMGSTQLTLAALAVGATMIPTIAQTGLRQSILLVSGNIWAALGPEYVLRPMLLLTGGLLLIFVQDSNAESALLVALVASMATLMTGMLLVRRLSNAEPFESGDIGDRALWATNARSTMYFNGAYQLLAYGDVLVAGLMLHAEDLGYYAAARALAMIGTFALAAMQVAIGPSVSAALHSSRIPEVRRIAVSVARVAVLFAAAYGFLLLIVGRPVLLLFGPGFGAAYPALMALLVAQFINAAAGPLGAVVTMSGLQREAAVVYVIATVVLAAAAIALSIKYGVVGIACSVLLATATWTILLNRLLAKKIRLSTWIFSRETANGAPEST
jgi:O-antigen/teichoic acid export membrane protein